MPTEAFKINIKGELVDIKDTKKVVDLLTKPLQEKIQKIKDDQVSINQQKITCKKFEDLNEKLHIDIKKFIPSDINKPGVFDEKAIFPVGIQVADFMSYIDITAKPECQISSSPIIVKIEKIALPEMLQSIGFSSKISNATESGGIINKNLLKPGSFKILQKNNAIESQYKFDNAADVAVGNEVGKFSEGNFFINDKKILLSAGNTLKSICEQINKLKIGVKADVESDTNNKYRIILRSETIGADNVIKIYDPNMVLKTADQFIKLPEYNTVTINQGDSLNRIANKINEFKKSTNLHADVFQIGHGQYSLILKSDIPGIENGFKILDNNNSVFQNVFKDQPVQDPVDAQIIVDGIKITSTTNKLQIYDGIDITLRTPCSKELVFDVQNNFNAIFTAIISFVDNYNAFRQSYEGDKADLKAKNYLKDNIRIKNSFMRIDESLRAIEGFEIGISKGKITVEKRDGDKDIKIEYDQMIELNESKLIEVIQSDPIKVQKAFVESFDSTSENFVTPILRRQIGVNNKPLGTNKIELDLDIKLDAITVKSKSSTAFPNSYVINNHDKDSKKFKSGTFFINGSIISIKEGMHLQDIVYAINQVSQMSRINAVIESDGNNNSYIRFSEYSGAYKASDDWIYFDKLNLHDPNNVLRDVFSVAITTGDFDVLTLNQQTNEINQLQPLAINGINITPHLNTLESLISAINEQTSATGVIAKGVLNLDTNKYRLVFDTEKLQDITIQNTGCIASTINLPTSIPIYQQNQEFFDTSMAIKSEVIVNDKVYHKSCLFSMSGEDKSSGGSILVINNDNTNMNIENVEVWFVGAQSEHTHISISQGIVGNVLTELDSIFKFQQGYSGPKPISKVFSEINDKDRELIQSLQDKEGELTVEAKKIIKKVSAANSKIAISEAYSKMAQYINKAKDND